MKTRISDDAGCASYIFSNDLLKKQQIIDFVENDDNKKLIAEVYADLCRGQNIHHLLADQIAEKLGLEKSE